jgi:uncharacterized protein (DUF2336 family)
VSPAVAAALCEVGAMEASLALLDNPQAETPAFSLHRLAERFGAEPMLREALLGRTDLPARTRMHLSRSAGDGLVAFAIGCGWMNAERGERLKREALDQAAVTIAVASDTDDVDDLAAFMKDAGLLTPQLLLRSVLSGETRLMEATLAMLSGAEADKVAGMLRSPHGLGFRAVYRKAGLPSALEPAFAAALDALAEAARTGGQPSEARLSRRMIERVLTACAMIDGPDLGRLMALLTRFQAEAAREEARSMTEALKREARAAAVDDLERRLQDAVALELQVAA